MFWHSSFSKHLSILVVPVLLLMGQGSLQAAPLSLVTTVVPVAGNYLYDFAITNNSTTDPLFILSAVDFSLPTGSIVGGVLAPAGNGVVTDFSPASDFVEFSSDNLSGFPLGVAVDGFQFVTNTAFSSFTFTGNYLDSTQNILTQVPGTTSPVPEPSTLGLLAGASLLLFNRFRSFRKV